MLFLISDVKYSEKSLPRLIIDQYLLCHLIEMNCFFKITQLILHRNNCPTILHIYRARVSAKLCKSIQTRAYFHIRNESATFSSRYKEEQWRNFYSANYRILLYLRLIYFHGPTTPSLFVSPRRDLYEVSVANRNTRARTCIHPGIGYKHLAWIHCRRSGRLFKYRRRPTKRGELQIE